MMIPLLQEAVDALSSVPGIGKVTAMRMALFLLRRPEEETLRMGNALIRLRTEARYCRICNMLSEEEICPICADSRRDRSTILVVENIGVISPMDGIGPDDLPLDSLVERASSPEVREVIIAIGKGMAGETTSFYINRLLARTGVRVTAIARGVGFGDDLENADSLTLGMSIKNRTPLL